MKTFVAPEGAVGNLINCLKGCDLGQVVPKTTGLKM